MGRRKTRSRRTKTRCSKRIKRVCCKTRRRRSRRRWL